MFKTDLPQNKDFSNEEQKNNTSETQASETGASQSNQNLDRAPIWRFVLPFLVIFLVLGGNQKETWANDSGLYEAEIPKNAAFARVVYFSATQQPAMDAKIGKSILQIDANSASPFVVLQPGTHTFSVAGTDYTRKLEAGQKLSMGFHYDRADKAYTALGEISILPKAKKAKVKKSGKTSAQKSRAKLHLFNFLNTDRVSLETGNGKHKIIKPVQAGQHSFRTVNPIATDLRVSAEDNPVLQLPVQNLKEKREYSFFVFAEDTAPTVIFTVDGIVRN